MNATTNGRFPSETPRGESAAKTLADPGALALVARLSRSLGDREAGDRVVISVARLRNYSRSSAAEFERFRMRLAELLNGAGTDRNLVFDAELSPSDADLTLTGRAYLIQAAGFDQWEIYLELRRADAARPVWANLSPVRVLRQPPRMGQQVFVADP